LGSFGRDELQRRIAPEAKPPAAASSTSAMTTPEFVKVTDVDVDDDDEDFGRDIAFSAGVKYDTSDRLRSVPTVWPIPNLEKVGKDTRSRADSPRAQGSKHLYEYTRQNPDFAMALLSCLALRTGYVACFELDCRGRAAYVTENTVLFEIAELKVDDIRQARMQIVRALSMMFLVWDITSNEAQHATAVLNQLKAKKELKIEDASLVGYGYVYHWPKPQNDTEMVQRTPATKRRNTVCRLHSFRIPTS
jgi:hypothetical protein